MQNGIISKAMILKFICYVLHFKSSFRKVFEQTSYSVAPKHVKTKNVYFM